MLKVILKQTVPSVGKAGEIVKVSDGYARNYLFPKGWAVEADERNLAAFSQRHAQVLRREETAKKRAQIQAEEIQGLTCTITRRVGEQDKLYGSVTVKDLESALREKGHAIDRKQIVLAEPIRSLGMHPVKIRLAAGLTAEIRVVVVAEN